ncbi:hypothetical protein QTN25_005485 [Entamoeba marina]
MNNLLKVNLNVQSTSVIFPKHKLNKVQLDCPNALNFVNLIVDYVSASVGKQFESFGSTDFPSMQIYGHFTDPSFTLNLDLIDFNHLTSLTTCCNYSKQYPTSLQTLELYGNETFELLTIQKQLEPLCKLQHLSIPSSFISIIPSLTQLTSINFGYTFNNPNGSDGIYGPDSNIDLSKLTQLVSVTFDRSAYLQHLPISLTKLKIDVSSLFSYKEQDKYKIKLSLTHLTNLQLVDIQSYQVTFDLPSTLTTLSYEDKNNETTDFSESNLKHLKYCQNYFSQNSIILPLTITSFDYIFRDKIASFDISKYANLTSLTISAHEYYYYTSQEKHATWDLPTSLQQLSVKVGDEVKIQFNNLNKTSLPDEVKLKFS